MKDDVAYNESQNYIDLLHGRSKSTAWITKAVKVDGWHQYHYRLQELVQLSFFDEDDVYISVNDYFKPRRLLENIKCFNALFIDIDCTDKDATLFFLEKDFYKQTIPVPSFVVDSGRGLHLYWLLDQPPQKAMPLWTSIQKYLYTQLKDLGADANSLDATRVLRVPGSINTKTNTHVKIIDKFNYTYTLREIQENYLPDLLPKPTADKTKKAPRSKAHIAQLYNAYSLHYARLIDIAELCELRSYNVTGYREFILFLYRYYSCYFLLDAQQALDAVLELNNRFIEPLRERDVIRDTRSAEAVFKDKDKTYKYKNQTLIDMLNITPEEQTHMKTIIGMPEKLRRQRKAYNIGLKEKGLINRNEIKETNMKKVCELKRTGMSTKGISEKLEIPYRTCKFYISQLIKRGDFG